MNIIYSNFEYEKVRDDIRKYIENIIDRIENKITNDKLWRKIFNSPTGLIEVIVEEDDYNECYTIYPKVREEKGNEYMSYCLVYVDDDTNEVTHVWEEIKQ